MNAESVFTILMGIASFVKLQFSSQKNNNVNLMLSIVFVFFLNAVASITGGCACESALLFG
jgi:hypothetical protein